jgi:hypothetical protein
MNSPQDDKEPAATQYVFHVQDATGLVTRLESVSPDGERKEMEVPQGMTLRMPSTGDSGGEAASAQAREDAPQGVPPHAPGHNPGPHPAGAAQGTFLWSEMGAHGQPSGPGPAVVIRGGAGPAFGPQFTGPHGGAPGTHLFGGGFGPGPQMGGGPGPHGAPAGRTVKLQLTPPGFGGTARLHGGAPQMGAPGATMGPGGFGHAPAMGGGCVSGPAMGVPGAHGPGGHGPGTGGPQFGFGPHGPGTVRL